MCAWLGFQFPHVPVSTSGVPQKPLDLHFSHSRSKQCQHSSIQQESTMSPTMHVLLIATVLALGWCCANNNGVMAMSYPRRASLSDPASAWLAAADTNLPSTAAAATPATPPVPQQQQSLRLTLFEDFTGSTLNTTRWNVRNNESHCCPAEPELYLADEVNTPASSSMQSYHLPVVHTLVCRPSGVPRRWLPSAANTTAQRDRATWRSLQVHKWMGGHQGEVVPGTVVPPR